MSGLRFWNFPIATSPSVIEALQHFSHSSLGIQLLVLTIEQQCSACIFTAVMSLLLNVHVEEEPCQELEGDVPLVGKVEELHGVYNLLWRNLKIHNTLLGPCSHFWGRHLFGATYEKVCDFRHVLGPSPTVVIFGFCGAEKFFRHMVLLVAHHKLQNGVTFCGSLLSRGHYCRSSGN